jgi:hypothetical protein
MITQPSDDVFEVRQSMARVLDFALRALGARRAMNS